MLDVMEGEMTSVKVDPSATVGMTNEVSGTSCPLQYVFRPLNFRVIHTRRHAKGFHLIRGVRNQIAASLRSSQ